MGELRFAAALLIWGLLPGFILLRLAAVRWSAVEQAAAAPGLSIVLVAFAAYVAEMAGLPVSPLAVAAVLIAGGALIAAARRRDPPVDVSPVPSWPFELAPRAAWVPWLVFLVPLAIVWQLRTVSQAALLPPSLHDGLDHANWFRLIFETRSVSPHEVMAPPLGPAGEPAYYPWGMHAWAALIARTSGLDPVAAFMRAMVAISAMVPLSVYVFSALFAGRGWTAMAGAVFSLIFWWLPYQVWSWGGYALLAGAVAALPVSRLALRAVHTRSRAAMALGAAAMSGLLFVHPSQLFLALVVAAVVSVTFAAADLTSRRTATIFVVLVAASGAAMLAGGMLWQPVADFLQRARDVSVTAASEARYRSPIAVYFDADLPRPPAIRNVSLLLWTAGALACALHRRLRAVLALHLVFGALVLAARHQTWVTALWYHLPERIWYAQLTNQPLLAAIGVGAVLRVLAVVVRRWIEVRRWTFAIWPLTLWAAFVPMHERFAPWAEWRLYHAVYRNPQFALTDRRVLRDFEWIRLNIPRDEVIFNAPGDWGLTLPFTGHRTVFWSGGYAFDPSTPWHDWLDLMQRGDPYSSQAAAELSVRGVNYVYAARLSPALERRGRRSLDAGPLRDAHGLTPVYASPTASIMRIAEARPLLLGLQDSRRIRYERFHPAEQLGRQRWRWTDGAGRLLLTVPAGAKGDCHLRILGSHPDSFEIQVGGRRVPLTPRGFPVASNPLEGSRVEVDILSPSFVPDPAGGDTRKLGVRVSEVSFTCQA
jgi:hypothetical protein